MPVGVGFVNTMYMVVGVIGTMSSLGLGAWGVAEFRRAYVLGDQMYGLNGFVLFMTAVLVFLGSYLFGGMLKLP